MSDCYDIKNAQRTALYGIIYNSSEKKSTFVIIQNTKKC